MNAWGGLCLEWGVPSAVARLGAELPVWLVVPSWAM
jgi:hypothetical protein